MAVDRTCEINLDSVKSVFYAGQSFSGCVEFQFRSPVTFSVVHVTFLGEAVVDWTERESETYNGQKRYKNTSYLGREEYVNVTHVLAGGYNSAPIQLPPGTYKYPFSFTIPPKSPSTFKGERGRVDYVIKVNMMFQGNAMMEDVIKHVDVIAPFDLNTGSERIKQPLEMELETEACGCLCLSDYVTVRVKLPVAGYCPGQVMPVEVNVDNRSSVEVLKILLQLVQKERYITQRPRSEYIPPEIILLTEVKGPVLSRSERVFNVDLRVPDIVVPNMENCSIIDVGYFIKATVKLSGCNSDMDDETECCLGILPLKETIVGTYVHPMAHCLPDGPVPIIQDANGSSIQIQEGYKNSALSPNMAGPYFVGSNPHPVGSNPNINPSYPTGTNPNMTAPYPMGSNPNINTSYSNPNISVSFPTGRSPSPNANYNTSYNVQMSQTFTSSDPSKNYHIGFSSSGPGTEMTQVVYGQKEGFNMPDLPNLRINLPPYPGAPQAPEPSAPPPSS